MSAGPAFLPQRLIANIQVEVPGPELVKRSHDQQILLLVQVTNGLGVSFRNYGLLELDKMKAGVEAQRCAVLLAGRSPSQASMTSPWPCGTRHQANTVSCAACFTWMPIKNDPLPSMWRGLDAFEFWSTSRDGPEFIFHSDIDGHLHLPVLSKRPILHAGAAGCDSLG